jgi:hypothetical protein
MQHALVGWGAPAVAVAVDTSMVWKTYGLLRLSVIYRGRAVPLVWGGLHHGSAPGGCEADQEWLTRAAWLLPRRGAGVFLADRGFADTALMAHRQRLGWHWRMRIKRSFGLERRGHRRCQVERLSVARGQACVWPQVSLTDKRDGPVHLAVARPWPGQEVWYVRSDEPTDEKTCKEYGLRCDMEEHFVDDNSNGWQWASSLIRSAPALTRLCLVLATTTCSLVSQGVEVVQQGKRRWVDPHGLRGQSSLKLGWNWVQWALSRGWDLLTNLLLSGDADPKPARASTRQYQHDCQTRFAFEFQDAA